MPTTYLLGKLEGTDADISGVSESETNVSESDVLDRMYVGFRAGRCQGTGC